MNGLGGDESVRASKADTLGALVKGLAIIELFGSGKSRLTVADAAKGVGITRAAARRCLLTLGELGYVAHDGKFFSPTPRLRRLGGPPRPSQSFVEAAQPHLDALRDQLHESVSLAVLEGDTSLFVGRAEAEHIVSTGVKVGRRLPAYCSATGRVLLGVLPDEEIVSMLEQTERPRRTSFTLIDGPSILRAIQVARTEGYACSDEELEIGLRSIAVPIFDTEGQCFASLSLSASASRLSLKTMLANCLPALQERARVLGEIGSAHQ
jgi:IclR family transcriptional regulator, pca regulon regulatory protein